MTIGLWLPLTNAGRQVGTAAILFLVGFMESISISKALARKHNYHVDVTQEIIALGFANLLGGMFSAYPATGSFSRSAVSADVGAKTQLQGAITGALAAFAVVALLETCTLLVRVILTILQQGCIVCAAHYRVLVSDKVSNAGVVVMLVLLFITPVFERVPYNAMGAIVLSSVLGLFELSEARFLFKANKLDFIVWLAAFLGTIFAGVEIGLGIAIGLAIVLVVSQSAVPHTAVLGRLPETRALPTKLICTCAHGACTACAILHSFEWLRLSLQAWDAGLYSDVRIGVWRVTSLRRAEVYRNIKQYPAARQHPHICVMRMDAPIYFANVEWIRGRIQKYKERADGDPKLGPIYFIILDMAPVPFVDSTGAPTWVLHSRSMQRASKCLC